MSSPEKLLASHFQLLISQTLCNKPLPIEGTTLEIETAQWPVINPGELVKNILRDFTGQITYITLA